jgi:hypothetical protein
MSISRRDFLGTAAVAGLTATALGADSTKSLPTRVLGKTGARFHAGIRHGQPLPELQG